MTGPGLLLRLEGLAVLGASLVFYGLLGGGWWWFVLFFLVPDVSMLGYAAGKRVGAVCYNIVHTYALPLALGAGAALLASRTMALAALIWLAHIGMDRMLGFGLKYQMGFRDTHIGRV